MISKHTELRTLIVEDNEVDADLLQEYLQESWPHGVSCHQVLRLEDAIGWLRTNAVDLVFLDLGLPDSEGVLTVERLLAEMPDSNIIVFTGLEDREIGQEADLPQVFGPLRNS